jgi:hypothetical protein
MFSNTSTVEYETQRKAAAMHAQINPDKCGFCRANVQMTNVRRCRVCGVGCCGRCGVQGITGNFVCFGCEDEATVREAMAGEVS